MDIPEVAEVILNVSEVYGVPVHSILGSSQAADIVEARYEAFAVVWEMNRYTLAQLGRLFKKTGEGVAYGLRQHYERLRSGSRSW